MPACVCVIRIAIFLHICGLSYNIKDFKEIDVALEQELVCRMHLIVHLLALTSECVLPAVSNGRGKSWGFPERLDDVSTYFKFVVGGERFGLPHFKTQKLLTLSAINLVCQCTRTADCGV